jgi:hypothetical protein
MSIEVRPVTDGERERWNEFVSQSPHGTIFHRLEFLRVLERQTDATLHLLIGYKSEEVRGIFPLFERSVGPVRLLFSPPPGMGVPYLGPALLNFGKMKQRKTERSNRRFVEGCLQWTSEEFAPHYQYVVTDWTYSDVRPFQWNEFSCRPLYSYRLEVEDSESLMETITRSARRSIQRNREANFEVERRDSEGLTRVLADVEDRYREQDERCPLDREYLRDLQATLADDRLRVYLGFVNGECQTGRIVLQNDERVYFWQGATKPDAHVRIPINDLLNWHTMTAAIDNGGSVVDIVGANTRRLCDYKSKYNPQLVEYYALDRAVTGVGPLVDVYKRIR